MVGTGRGKATHHSRRKILCGPKDANPKAEGADHRDGVCYVHTQHALDLPTFSLEREAIFHLNVDNYPVHGAPRICEWQIIATSAEVMGNPS